MPRSPALRDCHPSSSRCPPRLASGSGRGWPRSHRIIGTNWLLVDSALRDVLGDDDLRLAVDRDLGVVGLHEAVFALHDPALRIGEVLLRLGLGRGRGRSRRPSRLLASFGFALRLRLGSGSQLGVGRSLRLRFQFGLGLANPLGAPLLVGDPIRHLRAALVGAVGACLRGVRSIGCAQPPNLDLGFQLRGALLHALVAHRLVLRGVGFDLGTVEGDMAELRRGRPSRTDAGLAKTAPPSAFRCRRRNAETVRKSGASKPRYMNRCS